MRIGPKILLRRVPPIGVIRDMSKILDDVTQTNFFSLIFFSVTVYSICVISRVYPKGRDAPKQPVGPNPQKCIMNPCFLLCNRPLPVSFPVLNLAYRCHAS